ncbi:MAG: hypothetical protein OER83_05400 [Flavobacteriaceae bacterium]|nr:hypothetical protein [Flavobacteriaceae bacterium]MDH3796288.1 hypothetical protein [Flavobacteriaceae bacterium]
MKKINKLQIFPFALFQGILTGLLGLVCGILYSIGGFLIDAVVSLGWVSGEYWETPGLSYGTLLAFGALIGMPLIFAAVGFVAGIVEAVLFNLLVRRFGGVKLSIFSE